MHNFKDDLQFSERPEHEIFWESVYRSRFPELAAYARNDADNTGQRRGVDRLLYLGNDKILRVDEKLDRHKPDNFFLEYVSADTSNAPGWLEKDLACDYIAYAFINHGLCEFLPWHDLKRAWSDNKSEWLRVYRSHEIPNGRYKTVGVAVPREVVKKAIGAAMCIGFARVAVPVAKESTIPTTPKGRRIGSLDEFIELYPAVLNRVKRKIGIAAVAYIHDARPVALTETDAVIEFEGEFHYEKAREAAKHLPFEQVLNECFATPKRLQFRLPASSAGGAL